jgi:single-strand DNA-binding protein
MAINKVILLGNLGKDPEMRATASGMQVARFSLATSERRKDQSGQQVEHTEWHNIVSFGKTAELCQRYLKKGRQVFIEGRIRTNKWQDKEGKDRYTTEIICDNVQFIGSRGDSAGGDYASAAPVANDNVLAGIPTADALPRAANGGSSSVSDEPVTFEDDDIPF